ncbi:MAG: hypothetical protein FJY10_00945 [Bacteroidetes bacterium]|nr:hypothetical protein [Bacteroidota bacterium]
MKKLQWFAVISLIICGMGSVSCAKKGAGTATSTNKDTQHADPGTGVASPPVIIYKTKTNYNDKVPVILSEDKRKIVSYPDIHDIYLQGANAYPVPLEDGFLLDMRGIGPGVAFTSFSYEEFVKLDQTPPAEELFKSIIDNDPLVEMYQCGNKHQYGNLPDELNAFIQKRDFTQCKKLK